MDDELLYDFSNNLNQELENHFCCSANAADLKNENAYYVVRTDDQKVLFYFSLKCGLLFEKAIPQELIELCHAYFDRQNQTLQVKSKLIDFQTAYNFSENEMFDYFSNLSQKIRYQKKAANENNRVKESNNVELVPQSIPAIELSHFCKNEANDSFNEYLFPNHKLGEIIFWFFVLPIVQEALKYIGGQYIYLFAVVGADENEPLVNYYNRLLKFDKKPIWGTYKSTYAQSCRFMCLDINKALDFKKLISSNFDEHWGTLAMTDSLSNI